MVGYPLCVGAYIHNIFRNDFNSSCQLKFTGYEDFVHFVGASFYGDSCARRFKLFRNSVSMLLLRPDETSVQLKTSLKPSPQIFTHYVVNNFAIGTFSCVWEPHVSVFKKSERGKFFGISSVEIIETLRQNPALPVPDIPLLLNPDRPIPDGNDFDYLFVSFYKAENPKVSKKVYIPLL